MRQSPQRVLPFRWRLALASLALVMLTVGLMLVTLYVSVRTQVTNAYRERLTAAALGGSIAIPSDTVDALAYSEARVSVPYLVARMALRQFWRSDSAAKTTTGEGLALVRPIAGAYRMLAHSSWGTSRPDTPPIWVAPDGLRDSLTTMRAGETHTYWFTDGETLTAIAPVLSSNSIPVGLVVARLSVQDAMADVRASLLHLAWLPALALALALVLAYWVSGQLTRRVEHLAVSAQLLARGDLRREITDTSGDELGILAVSLRDLRDHLRALLVDVNSGAAEVTETVHTIARDSDDMRIATTDVAAAAHNITQTAHRQTEQLDAISRLASHAVVQAQSVTNFATGADTAAERIVASAHHVVHEAEIALQRMTEIAAVTADAVPAVAELGVKSRRITTIAASIAKLANQSNLLAVNAAIEAARAGDQGRGFAIIADEVRALADATASALESIHDLAGEIYVVSDRTGTRMDEVQRSVTSGDTVIRSSAQSLKAIMADAEHSRAAAAGIASLAVEQHARAATMSEHMREIALGAAENAAAARQVVAVVDAQTTTATGLAETSHRLAAVATQLSGYLVRFEL